jgi:Flp pilus assembly pilin Flp
MQPRLPEVLFRKETKMKTMRDFWRDETGMGTVEIILIIVVLIGLVIIFKKQLNDLVKKVFKKINSDSGSIISAAVRDKC